MIFSALFLVALLAQNFYFTPITRQRLIEHSINDQAYIADLSKKQIEAALRSAQHEIEFVAKEIERGPASKARIDGILSSSEEISEYYKTFYVLDMDAKWVSFPRKPEFVGRMIPMDNLYWVKEVFSLNRTVSLDVNRSRIGTMVSGFARPLRFESGESGYLLRGVIALTEDNALLRLVDEIKMGESGYAYLVSREGMILAHPGINNETGGVPVDYSGYPPVAALMRGEEGNMEYISNEINWAAAYRRIEPFGWGLVVKQPLQEITRPADVEARMILAFSGTALLIGSLIFLFVMHLSLRPLGDLLYKIRRGKAIDQNSFPRDETGQLAARFNELFAELSRAKKDKEVLLAEMHHRVKNNMQTVSSLLMIQEDTADDPIVRKAFSESVSRIRAMALVHEALYKSDDLSNVDIAEYVDQLITAYAGGPATIESRISPMRMGIQTAIPLGIIINELVANALEHAFVGIEGGKVMIECARAEDGMCALMVSDNGLGLPDDGQMPEKKSLGLLLVHLFVGQLKGRMSIERGGGTRFTITFKPSQ